jgi:hypothetical protein
MHSTWDTYQATRERLTAAGRPLTDAQAVVLTYLAVAGSRGLTEDELQERAGALALRCILAELLADQMVQELPAQGAARCFRALRPEAG